MKQVKRFIDCFSHNSGNLAITDHLLVLEEFLNSGKVNSLFDLVYPKPDDISQIRTQAFQTLNLFASEFYKALRAYFVSNSNHNDPFDLMSRGNSERNNYLPQDAFWLISVIVGNHMPILRQPLRVPFNEALNNSRLKEFYDLLEEIRDIRNLWFHNNIDATYTELREIVRILKRFCSMLGIPYGVVQDSVVTVDSKIVIGESLGNNFDINVYTLKLNGYILDRSTEKYLHTIIPSTIAKELGKELLSLKPSGGRLKIVADGDARKIYVFDDFDKNGVKRFGYILTINKNEWFR
jgi:hypothetical protein